MYAGADSGILQGGGVQVRRNFQTDKPKKTFEGVWTREFFKGGGGGG